MANDIITIDGITYPVNIVSFNEISEFVDKYAERTQDWNLRRELAGIFFNYELTLGKIQDEAVMQNLYDKIHEPVEFHTVTLPHNDGFQTFTAYITGVPRPLIKRVKGKNKWGGYVIKFIAKAPQITA